MAMENETFMSFIDDLPIEMFENWDFHGFPICLLNYVALFFLLPEVI